MIVLGINAYHADVSAALIVDGRIVAAVEEERLRRVKHCAGVPELAIRACLEIAGVAASDVDRFAIGRQPAAHRLRRAVWTLKNRPSLGLVGDRLRNHAQLTDLPARVAEIVDLPEPEVRSRWCEVEHHVAHLASAFYPSGFERAAVCAIDGFGDFVSTSWCAAAGSDLGRVQRIWFPHSLGLLYLALTQYLGFPNFGDEYKVMGLAAYGEAEFADAIGRLIRPTGAGRFQLDLDYFRHADSAASPGWERLEPNVERMYTPQLEALLGPARHAAAEIEDRHRAIAASLQKVYEQRMSSTLSELRASSGSSRLCLAGGCAFNSVANGRVPSQAGFDELFVQPAAGDAGTALGAALEVWHRLESRQDPDARIEPMEHAYLGPSFEDSECLDALGRSPLRVAPAPGDEERRLRKVVEILASGGIVGWFEGRMEWGPRALGARSILADPRRAESRQRINAAVKEREDFRPFAASVLASELDQVYEGARRDPFMTQVFPMKASARRDLPAVCHVDGSGRVQSVDARSNPKFHRLLMMWREATGVPALLNTSFNRREPIVCTPLEAVATFEASGLDALVLEDHLVEPAAALTAVP